MRDMPSVPCNRGRAGVDRSAQPWLGDPDHKTVVWHIACILVKKLSIDCPRSGVADRAGDQLPLRRPADSRPMLRTDQAADSHRATRMVRRAPGAARISDAERPRQAIYSCTTVHCALPELPL